MKKVNEIVDILYLGFEQCKIAKAHHEGGEMRGTKGQLWEEFAKQVLLHAIKNSERNLSIEDRKKVLVPVIPNNIKIVELELQRRLTNRVYRAGVFAVISASLFGLAQVICLLVK